MSRRPITYNFNKIRLQDHEAVLDLNKIEILLEVSSFNIINQQFQLSY